MRGPKEKKERRIGERLNLKADRCQSPKCAMVRKPYQPGAHGPTGRRRALSEFGVQLREKQKVKISYGLDERNLRQLFVSAQKTKGSSSSKLVELLERRLDNVIMKLGLAASRHLDAGKLEGKVVSLPQESSVPFEASLLIESFSK